MSLSCLCHTTGAVDAVSGTAQNRPGARRGLTTSEVGSEGPDVPLRAELLDERVELLLRDHLDIEEHLRVVLAAQLRALALEDARPPRYDLELVPHAGEDVHLVQEGRDPERVDDVA